jgi:malic enzyme
VHRASTGPLDLSTPTIKSPTYTTGRGGTGNMAHNDLRHPELARASQDVEARPVEPVPRQKAVAAAAGSANDHHHHLGRGGQGNIVSSPSRKHEADRVAEAAAEARESVLAQRKSKESVVMEDLAGKK